MKRICWIALTILVIFSQLLHGGARPVSEPDRMAIPASLASLEAFISRQGNAEYLVFPETRENPIRLLDGIPEIWTRRTPGELERFEGSARPAEYYVFQIGVYAHKKEIRGLHVHWTDLEGAAPIEAGALTCFNTSGIDYTGEPFTKSVTVARGRVQPLWFGLQVPADAQGTYRTTLNLIADNMDRVTVAFQLTVRGTRVRNNGFDDGKSLARLAWLNTTLGDDGTVTKGYQEIHRTGNTIGILGRSLEVGPHGLPSKITTFFEPSNQFLLPMGEPILAGSFRFLIELADGAAIPLTPGPLRYVAESRSAVAWEVLNSSPECDLICTGRMEFDGFVGYTMTLRAKKPLRVRDVRLEIPMEKSKAVYMMGLNHEGGLRPAEWHWNWDTTRNQDMLWIGGVNGGIRVHWKADNSIRPLINIYYAYGRLHLPRSWGNQGKGGVAVTEENPGVLVRAFSGARDIAPGSELHFNFDLLLTPFRIIDRSVKFGDRYFHGGGTNAFAKIAMADSAGANIINIHHAEDLYPFINYPYLDENVPDLKRLVDSAHTRNKRLKLYYTTRELTKNLPEFWAFVSLNGEIIYPGPGDRCTTIINPKGPDEWLKRNLKEHYIPAWLNTIKEGRFVGELDLSVITTPDSRLNNFYIGGLNWMLENLLIDGVYIDDSALDRQTLRRARRLIDRHRPEGRIDFHSWNHFNDLAGYANCLNLYMDLLPYFDLVWIGEGRDYDRAPDHWLIEVSGIPFGLPGQMLAGGGNPWRGMVYGITNRAGWMGYPSEIWKFWDACQIQEKEMVGYWDASSPLTCTNDSVRATLYKGREESVLAIANWGSEEQRCSIRIDWAKLGYDSAACSLTIPRIPGYQDTPPRASLDEIRVPGRKGYLILMRNRAVRP